MGERDNSNELDGLEIISRMEKRKVVNNFSKREAVISIYIRNSLMSTGYSVNVSKFLITSLGLTNCLNKENNYDESVKVIVSRDKTNKRKVFISFITEPTENKNIPIIKRYSNNFRINDTDVVTKLADTFWINETSKTVKLFIDLKNPIEKVIVGVNDKPQKLYRVFDVPELRKDMDAQRFIEYTKYYDNQIY